ncbi:hypothetical protein [Falsiroseomonas sp.]|uniref:hypothetical protein n=1 Tax=Falsiroseomonas sp. TaxID=2870721 RepID=UPI003F70A92D
MPLPLNSLFQVLFKVKAGNGNHEEDWSTAFSVVYQNNPVLVTTRHTFMKAKLGPLLPIAIRTEGEDWTLPPVDIQVVAHPVADLCMLLAPNGYGRALNPMTVLDLQKLPAGDSLEVQGFPGQTRYNIVLPAPLKFSGTLKGAPSTRTIGRHRLVTAMTNLPEQHGLSGSPIVATNSGGVVGVYSSGFGSGAIIADASQIAEL